MAKLAFLITEVPSLDASRRQVYVDIGFLADEEHANAFVDIFEKFVQDNSRILSAFQRVEVQSAKPVAGGFANAAALLNAPRVVAKQLYESYNEEVRLMLTGETGSAVLVVTFDNPSFRFERAI